MVTKKYVEIDIKIPNKPIYFCDMLIAVDASKAIEIDGKFFIPDSEKAAAMCRNRATEEIDGALVCEVCKELKKTNPEYITFIPSASGKEYQDSTRVDTFKSLLKAGGDEYGD